MISSNGKATEPTLMAGQAKPADQKSVRRHNLGLVLENLVRGGRRSRARISTETGLNPSTVSSLIADLIAKGLLREVGVEQDGSIGRPGRSLELDPDGGAALGIEISDDGIGLVALDLAGVPRFRAFYRQLNRDIEPQSVVKQIAGLANEALRSFKSRNVRTACTLAVPGLITGDGQFLEAPNIGWHDVPIGALWRSESSNIPLLMENEARLAAYAEMSAGVATNLRSFAYISGATGLGAGLVINGQIFRGAHGFAGEFGHVAIDRNCEISGWEGTGTVQSLAGEQALAALAELPVESQRARNDPDWVGHEIARRVQAGDPLALSTLKRIGADLGIGLSTLCNLFDMEAIVLGGYLTHLSEWLSGPIEAELDKRVISRRWQPMPVLFSTMGREAAVRGAASWSLDTILTNFDFEDN